VRTRTSDDAMQALVDEVRDLRSALVPTRRVFLAHAAAEMIRARSARLSLSDIGRELGITHRHLRRVVRESTGIGAKQFQRVHRLNRAVARSDAIARPEWARIAAETGYYDQSHLIREFLALTGRTPIELHRERQAENVIAGRGTRDGGLPNGGRIYPSESSRASATSRGSTRLHRERVLGPESIPRLAALTRYDGSL
jgi:AraC-like DNA-binding protein